MTVKIIWIHQLITVHLKANLLYERTSPRCSKVSITTPSVGAILKSLLVFPFFPLAGQYPKLSRFAGACDLIWKSPRVRVRTAARVDTSSLQEAPGVTWSTNRNINQAQFTVITH